MSFIGLSASPSLAQLSRRIATRIAPGCIRLQLPRLLSTRASNPPTPLRNPRLAPSTLTTRVQWRTAPFQARRSLFSKSVLTLYEEIPRDYKDSQGLPFQKMELTQEEAFKLFGPSLKADEANRLLRILHGRRVAGTLDDPAYRVNTAAYTEAEQRKALEYLRATIPVDEVMNSGLRAQDELEQLEKGTSKVPSEPKTGSLRTSMLYKPDKPTEHEVSSANESSSTSGAGEVEEVYKPDPIYGYSQLEAMQVSNRAAERAKAKLREEERQERLKARGPATPGSLMAYIEGGDMSPQMQKWHEEGTSPIYEAPALTRWQRLGPSLAFVCLLVAACAALATTYAPLDPEYRLLPRLSPGMATVSVLMGLNLLVFGAWKIPPLWKFMNKYFIMVVGMPQPITMLTSMFSHSSFTHMFLCMAALFYIGPKLHDDIGRGNFLALYLSSGALGYAASLCWHPLHVCVMGASCAVYGTMAAYFWLHRTDTFKVLGLPPDPMEGIHGVVFLALIVALHLGGWYGSLRVVSRTDFSSHWGGMLTAVAWIQILDFMGRIGGQQRQRDSTGQVSERGTDAGEQGGYPLSEKKNSLDLFLRKHPG